MISVPAAVQRKLCRLFVFWTGNGGKRFPKNAKKGRPELSFRTPSSARPLGGTDCGDKDMNGAGRFRARLKSDPPFSDFRIP